MGPVTTEPSWDSVHFRTVLGHFATGVAIITAVDDGEPVGFSCQSFSSLSLDPPLVGFAPSRTSSSWPHIRNAGVFCANVLAADQQELCKQFATPGIDKFAGVDWRVSPTGCPILPDVLAWVDATFESELEAGDHTVAVGRVVDLAVERDADPLLFFRGAYGKFSL